MKEKFLKSSINTIIEYKSYSQEDIDKLRYGLEGLYLTITKLIVISIIALLLNMFKELIILLIFFNIIRFFAFGLHADKSGVCLISSLILIIGLTYVGTNFYINNVVKITLSIITIINFSIYAPADTIKRPLTSSKKRKYRKLFSIIIVLLYIGLSFILKNNLMSNLMLMSLVTEGILINPITYKVFKMPYKNYKNVS